MSQNTSVESSTRSSPNQSINPALQAALGSLDVQIEEELARYRRQRAGRPVMSPRSLGRSQTRKPIELISVDKTGSQTQPQLPASRRPPAPPMMSFPLALVNPTPTDAPPKETNPDQLIETGQLEQPWSAASEASDALATPSRPMADNRVTQEGITEQPTPAQEPADAGSDLVTVAPVQAQPEDYLESSEKLLQSLAEEEPRTQPRKRFTDKLLTPLGIGSMLLLLLSGATLAYLVTNPSTLSALGLDRLFGSETPTTAQSPTQTTQRTQTTQANGDVAKDSPIVSGPNLASEEFPEVNLNTLSHLEASPSPSPLPPPVPVLPDLPSAEVVPVAPVPNVAPNSVVPRRSSDLSSRLLQPALQPRTVPSVVAPPVVRPPVASAPPANTRNSATARAKPSPVPVTPANTEKPQPSPSPEQVAESPAPTEDNYYRVLVSYGGDRSLEEARKVVPDAYVLNLSDGTRIQMGAFKKESEAKSLVEQLQQQGISASINRP